MASRGWARGVQANRGKATENFFSKMGDIMFSQGVALVVKAESVWKPIMGEDEDGKRAVVGARPDRAQAGVPDFFAVLGPAGGGRGLFFEAKECNERKFNCHDSAKLRPKQREVMDLWSGELDRQARLRPNMEVPCFLVVRFPKADRIYRIPWPVARRLEAVDCRDPALDEFLVGPRFLEGLVL